MLKRNVNLQCNKKRSRHNLVTHLLSKQQLEKERVGLTYHQQATVKTKQLALRRNGKTNIEDY